MVEKKMEMAPYPWKGKLNNIPVELICSPHSI